MLHAIIYCIPSPGRRMGLNHGNYSSGLGFCLLRVHNGRKVAMESSPLHSMKIGKASVCCQSAPISDSPLAHINRKNRTRSYPPSFCLVHSTCCTPSVLHAIPRSAPQSTALNVSSRRESVLESDVLECLSVELVRGGRHSVKRKRDI